MNMRSLGALVALNLVLLAALMATVLMPSKAEAQLGALAKPQYLMVAGDVTGRRQQAAVYVIETNTAKMAAIFFNSGTNRIEVVGGREIGPDVGANNDR